MKEFVKCRCQHCGKGIEFDSQQLDGGESVTVDCPHCEKQTTLIAPHTSYTSVFAAGILDLGSLLIFILGAGLAAWGISGELHEETLQDGSAIRQAVYAVQYGSGTIIVALSMVVAALVRIIRKR
jgi:hypothetical protein